MSARLEVIEHAELMDGLMALTDDNLGLSHQLLQKVIKRTEYEVKATLEEISKNLDVEKRRAASKARRTINKNMKLGSLHPKKPAYTAAHHLVAWCDPRAQAALEILIRYDIDVHDEVNAEYLPCYEKHTPHDDMLNAKPHSKTHTDYYYENVKRR